MSLAEMFIIIFLIVIVAAVFIVFVRVGIDWLRDHFNDNSGPGVE